MRVHLALALTLLAPLPSGAVIIDSGDGTGNTSRPMPEDPGWDYVGFIPGFTAVYLGEGWAITADHAKPGRLVLPGGNYPLVRGSTVTLVNPESPSQRPDLELFRIGGNPGLPELPALPIRAAPPRPGKEAILIGSGRERGAFVSDCDGSPGWAFGQNRGRTRWGTNRILSVGFDRSDRTHLTRSFATRFDPGLPTPHEAQAAASDSGGAVFMRNGSRWELAGVMYAVSLCRSNPKAAIYGQHTFIADLSRYREQILSIVNARDGGERRASP